MRLGANQEMKERVAQILLTIGVFTLSTNQAVALLIASIAFCSVVSCMTAGAITALAIGICCALGGGVIRDLIFSDGNFACLTDPLYVPAAILGALCGLCMKRLRFQFDVSSLDSACSLAFAAIGFQTANRLGLEDSTFLILAVCYLTAFGGGLIILLFSDEPLREIGYRLAHQVIMVFAAIGLQKVNLPLDSISLAFLLALAVPRIPSHASNDDQNQALPSCQRRLSTTADEESLSTKPATRLQEDFP